MSAALSFAGPVISLQKLLASDTNLSLTLSTLPIVSVPGTSPNWEAAVCEVSDHFWDTPPQRGACYLEG